MALCHHSSGFLLTSLLLFLDAYCESIRMERPLVDPHGGDLVLVFLLVLGQCGIPDDRRNAGPAPCLVSNAHVILEL